MTDKRTADERWPWYSPEAQQILGHFSSAINMADMAHREGGPEDAWHHEAATLAMEGVVLPHMFELWKERVVRKRLEQEDLNDKEEDEERPEEQPGT